MDDRLDRRLLSLLVVAKLSVASAPLLIVLCRMPPASISAGRLLGAGLLFLPFALPRLRAELGKLSPRQWLALIAAGASFGLHLLLFIAAFGYTSFESAVVLLSFQPVFAGLLGWLLLGERMTGGMWLSIGLAAAGLGLLVWQDVLRDQELLEPRRVIGDLFVVLSCLAMVLTFILGRRLRKGLSYPVYVGVIFPVGGIVALAVALFWGESVNDTPPDAWGWLVAMILLPTIAGHSLFNYLVKYVRVFYVNIVFVVEPVLAMLGKWAIDRPDIFGEVEFGALQWTGSAILIAGVAIGLFAREKAAPIPALPLPLPRPVTSKAGS